MRVVDGGGDALRRARLAANDHDVVGPHDARDELGHHALEVEVLGEDVDPLGQLAKAHIGDVARDGGLRAGVPECLELLHERALGLNRLVAHDVSDGILPVVATLHCELVPLH